MHKKIYGSIKEIKIDLYMCILIHSFKKKLITSIYASFEII